MLERLTDRTGNGQVYLIEGPEEDMYGYYTGKGLKQIEKVIARLAAYEDSGLSPDEVQELAKAKADGRLVVLPCKVGENCFAVNHTEKKIVEITVSEYSYSIWHDAWIVSAANGCQFFLDNTHRTRVAAEKALVEAKRAAEEAFAEAFCDFAESHANREFERQMREGWEG